MTPFHSSITPSAEGPLNDLFLAINFYVSTGDHIGEGVAPDLGGGVLLVQIPYDPKNPDDAADFAKFKARMGEIGREHPSLAFAVRTLGETPGFTIAAFEINEGQMRDLARELVRSCGEAGWGTGKAVIDAHAPDVRAKLLSGEGV